MDDIIEIEKTMPQQKKAMKFGHLSPMASLVLTIGVFAFSAIAAVIFFFYAFLTLRVGIVYALISAFIMYLFVDFLLGALFSVLTNGSKNSQKSIFN